MKLYLDEWMARSSAMIGFALFGHMLISGIGSQLQRLKNLQIGQGRFIKRTRYGLWKAAVLGGELSLQKRLQLFLSVN